MDAALVDSKVVDLLSHITGQKLSQREITPPVIFLAALITVLLGVMLVDGTVTDEEKQRWQKTICRFIPPKGNVRQLAQIMSQGIQQNQLYKKFDELITLTASLSEPEKLLLVSFGYEMSAADGEMDCREKKYLETVVNWLGINQRHLAALEVRFTHSGTIEPAILDEVQSLLNPARFQLLDAIFVKAASNMLAALPTKVKHKASQQHTARSYVELKRFQEYRKQLTDYCEQLSLIIQKCNNRSALPHTLIDEVGKVLQKLQSQRFRVAVVGEFSQGKSTLLNALLGEQIQPVREIPCSGTVTTLKYGAQTRVVCHYKDGHQEEIPLELYQDKAAISEDAALGCLSENLANSEIKEIIFEHPNLKLCSSGVEIVDSPGLNEHPERTAVTQQLLKDTDAVIFLTNASRPLTQGERDLLQELKLQLNRSKEDKPADNIFVVGNFVDLIRTEKEREQVQQRIKKFVQGENPITVGENRIHFISAQKALDAILAGTQDEYLKTFQDFTYSLERFLTLERGNLEIKQSVTKLDGLIQVSLDNLHQAEEVLDGKLKLSASERQKILEQIGEASGRDFIIQDYAEQLIEAAINQTVESWDKWTEGVANRVADKSAEWNSQYSPLWDKEKLLQDYANQFNQSLSKELEDWWETKVIDGIVKKQLNCLDRKISYELEAIRYNFRHLDSQISTHLNEQFNLVTFAKEGYGFGINSTNKHDESEDNGGFSLMGGLGTGGLTVGALVLFTGLGLVPLLLAGGAAAAIGSFIFGGPSEEELHFKVKQQVYDLGFEKFNESAQEIFDKVTENITSIFDNRVEQADAAIKQIISCYENVLEQHEKAHKETLEQREAEKAWISQKRQELENVQKEIEAILN